ncbi:MAG: NAD-dependent DNA ligase LigA, partial [Phycisphaerales bacterium]
MSKPDTQARRRIDELKRLLERANRAYYVEASPIMSDTEFDALLRELESLERAHPEYDDPASPTRRVGGEPIDGFKTVTHAQPMLSIDNTYNLGYADNKGLLDWYDRVVEGLGTGRGGWDSASLFDGTSGDSHGHRASHPVLVADAKVDGVAMSIRYESGLLDRAVTRGDGTRGDDVTANVRTIRSLPLRLAGDDFPKILEIRGEVYFPLKEFERTNQEREAEGQDLFQNPRNAAAGTLKQLDPRITARRRLGFLAHGRGQISDDDWAKTHSDFLNRLKRL